MINPTWLRTFCTLAELRHFTRTADALHMTQSGVSQQLKKLEQQVGRELVVRDARRFRLTPAGERLALEGRQVLAALEGLAPLVAQDDPFAGEVRIMSPGSVGLRLYPRLLALQQQHPALVLDYRFAPNGDIEQAVADGRVVLGLMTQPPRLAEVHGRAIAEEPLLLVTPANIKVPHWQRLQALGFIDHPDGTYHAQQLLGANYPEYQQRERLRKTGFSNQIGLILEPVSLGLGFTVLPAHAVAAFHTPRAIRAHTLAVPVRETLFLVTAAGVPASARVATVEHAILQAL